MFMLTRRGVVCGLAGGLVVTGLAGCGSAPRAPLDAAPQRPPPVGEPEAVAPPHAQAVTLHALGLARRQGLEPVLVIHTPEAEAPSA